MSISGTCFCGLTNLGGSTESHGFSVMNFHRLAYYLFVKQINIYDFITRIEYFLVAGWNIGMFLKISMAFYCVTISTVQVFGFKNRKVIIIPMAIAIFIIILKTNILRSVIVFKFIQYYAPYVNVIFIFVIPVIALAMFFLGKAMKGRTSVNS